MKLRITNKKVGHLLDPDIKKIRNKIKHFVAKKSISHFQKEIIAFVEEKINFLKDNELLSVNDICQYLNILSEEFQKNSTTYFGINNNVWNENQEIFYRRIMLAAIIDYHLKLHEEKTSNSIKEEDKFEKYKHYIDKGGTGFEKSAKGALKTLEFLGKPSEKLERIVGRGSPTLTSASIVGHAFSIFFEIGMIIRDYFRSSGRSRTEKLQDAFRLSRTANIVLSGVTLILVVVGLLTKTLATLAIPFSTLGLFDKIARFAYYFYHRATLDKDLEALQQKISGRISKINRLKRDLRLLKERLIFEISSNLSNHRMMNFLQNTIKEKLRVIQEYENLKIKRQELLQEFVDLNQDFYYKIIKNIMGIIVALASLAAAFVVFFIPPTALVMALSIMILGTVDVGLFTLMDHILYRYHTVQAKKAEIPNVWVMIEPYPEEGISLTKLTVFSLPENTNRSSTLKTIIGLQDNNSQIEPILSRHASENWHPENVLKNWIPAYAGMTSELRKDSFIVKEPIQPYKSSLSL